MKKLSILCLSLFMLGSCNSDLLELNENTKAPTAVPAPTLFANAQKNLVDIITTPNVNSNIFRLLSQQWTQTTYIDESNYDLNTRNIPQNFWNALYRDVLRDFREAKMVIEANETLQPAVKANQLALVDIMEVYTFSILISTYGDVPYTEALDFNIVQPKYDNAQTIHADLVRRLNESISALNPGAGSFGNSDLIYGGDVENWIAFANSLKLKLGMLIADSDPATAKTIVESAAAGAFNSPAQNADFDYLPAPPNTNPVWVDLVQSGRFDFVGANTLVDRLKTLNDPRLGVFFTPDADGGFTGGTYGSSNNYATYSKVSSRFTDPSNETLLMSYSDVEFYLAEAAARGWNVGGTAKSHYNNAISASLKYFGVSDADIQAYLAQPTVAYETAAGDFRQKIGTQKWISLFNRGFDAWTEWRRLDYPQLNVPAGKTYADIPVRYTYPVNEQNLNKANYDAAASSVGGDRISTRLFWDVK